MKKIWICKWEIVPGKGEQTEIFYSEQAAKLAMRQKICGYITPEVVTENLDPVAAAFLRNYLKDPQFPGEGQKAPAAYEELEDGELYLGMECIHWEDWTGECPYLRTNLVRDDPGEEYRFDFWFDRPKPGRAKAMSVRIYEQMDYGTSAYPLMVRACLCETPLTQDQIVRRIFESWETVIERKSVGRHLQLLQDMGLGVEHTHEGYRRTDQTSEPRRDVKYGPSAYPLMVSQVLGPEPMTQAEIIQAVFEKYGTKMERKAVSRHLELLQTMFRHIKKDKNGYYVG